ncbi:hypothetical protein P9112_011385 [Eukaryota sp. TZLM1-RC]
MYSCVSFGACCRNTLYGRPIKVTVTGSAGKIGSNVAWGIAQGLAFGSSQSVDLRLFDIEKAQPTLSGMQMELSDITSPALNSVNITSDPEEAFAEADVVVMVASIGGVKPGGSRIDLVEQNGPLYREHGAAVDQYANPDCRIVVVSNPANTLCMIAASQCTRIPLKNWTSLCAADHLRAAHKLRTMLPNQPSACAIQRLGVIGNHSSTLTIPLKDVRINRGGTVEFLEELLNVEKASEEIIDYTRNRGLDIINTSGQSTIWTPSYGILIHLRNLIMGTSVNENISVGMVSDGIYGFPQGLVTSLPVISRGKGNLVAIEKLQFSAYGEKALKETIGELKQERDKVRELLGESFDEVLQTHKIDRINKDWL